VFIEGIILFKSNQENFLFRISFIAKHFYTPALLTKQKKKERLKGEKSFFQKGRYER